MIDLLKDIAGDGDLVISGNDLVIGNSDKQHMEDLVMTEKGSIKQYPDAGVGVQTFLEAENPAALLREISLQYTADGMQVKGISISEDGRINVNAAYK